MQNDIWQRHAEKMRRREQFERFDAWLKNLYEERPLHFHLFTIAIAVVLTSIVFGITALLDSIGSR